MSDPIALYDEADKLKAAGDLQGAADKLAEAIAADDSYALAHSAMAIVQQKLGAHDEAIKHAQRVCRLCSAMNGLRGV